MLDLFEFCLKNMWNCSLIQQILSPNKKIHEARAFNFTYRYIDDVLSIYNPRFAEFLSLIYPPELEIKEKKLDLFEFCLKNMWNCSLIQQILSPRFYD
jgi:hypothetical protein